MDTETRFIERHSLFIIVVMLAALVGLGAHAAYIRVVGDAVQALAGL